MVAFGLHGVHSEHGWLSQNILIIYHLDPDVWLYHTISEHLIFIYYVVV